MILKYLVKKKEVRSLRKIDSKDLVFKTEDFNLSTLIFFFFLTGCF